MQGGLGSGPAHTAHTEEDLHSPRQRENPTAGGQAEGELGKERAFFLAEQRALHLHFAPGLQGLAKEWIPGWGHRRDWALEQTN